jgi:hypothetical protein
MTAPGIAGGLKISLIIVGVLSLLGTILLGIRSVGTVPSPMRPAVPTFDVRLIEMILPFLRPGSLSAATARRAQDGGLPDGGPEVRE